jgi:hypothetical protein
MPYDIVKRKGKFCVVKADDNKTMGCHETREEALDQQRALYASERRKGRTDLSAPVRRG